MVGTQRKPLGRFDKTARTFSEFFKIHIATPFARIFAREGANIRRVRTALWHRTQGNVALISLKTRAGMGRKAGLSGLVALFLIRVRLRQAEGGRTACRPLLGVIRLVTAAGEAAVAIAVGLELTLLLPVTGLTRLRCLRHQNAI